jgi:hypothetical protein
MFGAEDDLHDKLCESDKRVKALEREANTMRKALGIALIAMEQHDHADGQDTFKGVRWALTEAMWPGPLTALAERRRTLEEELAKVIGEMQGEMSSIFDGKGKAVQVLLACNKGQQNCHDCPIITCCDNDTDAARLIRELASASDIGKDRLAEMIEAAKRVRSGG